MLLLVVALVLVATAAVVVVRRSRARRPEPAPGAGPVVAPVTHDTTRGAELPDPIADFVGRADDLTTLLRLVHAGHRAIAVTGAPGLGKSALAVRLAHELRPFYPDGLLYADLGSGRGDVPARLLDALGAPEEEQTGEAPALAARLHSRTARRRVLLLLDATTDAPQVRPLLLPGDGCLTLITSRNALTDLPEATPFPLEPLTESDAQRLWAIVPPGAPPAVPPGQSSGAGGGTTHAGRAMGEGGHIPPTGPHLADGLVRSCGRLPLAVRIAAAVGGQPSELAHRINAERARLDALHVGDVPARAAFEIAYATLTGADRHLLRSLGAYPGPRLTVRIAAAAAGWPHQAAHEGLQRLAAAQLAQPDGPDAYRLHALIRRFAAERLERDTAPAECRAALERLLAAGPEDSTAVSLLVRAGVREGLHGAAHHLATTADSRLRDEPSQLPRIAMWSAVLDAARRAGEHGWAAHALRGLGDAYRREGRYEQAVDHLRMSIAVQHRSGARAEQIETRRLLGDALHRAGRYDAALREFQMALDSSRALGGPTGEAEILRGLGALHLDRRRPDEAITCLEAAVPLTGCPDTRRVLGSAYVQTGNLTAAERCLRSALVTYRRHGRAVGEGWTLRELGYLEERRWAYGAGADHHRAALAAFDRVGYGTGVAAAAEAMGDNLLAQGNEAGADAEYLRAATAYADLGDHIREAEVRRKLSVP
ncbi:tetratricopeptide repeat protein [Streptomyces sp. NPDC002133]|uniref:tetratricopeptide repeat protein n=1 Tax=Streptomyces sp. NPDC002133 TaxID=3154409 RepID=UPI00332BAB66